MSLGIYKHTPLAPGGSERRRADLFCLHYFDLALHCLRHREINQRTKGARRGFF